MKSFKLNQDPKAAAKFESYPAAIKPKLDYLRALVLEAAEKNPDVLELDETLKWGEPSYLAKKGSTIRMDWKAKAPDQYAIYFKCTSKLVETFRAVYGDTFNYEKNRAIVFGMKDKVPKKELKDCINLALSYHNLKHLPLLGK